MKHLVDIEVNLNDLDSDEILAWVKENYDPEDVFEESALESWAEENGYMLVEEK